MTAPSVPASVWLVGAFDPVLIAIAVYFGWNADQFGKVFLAVIAAVGVSALIAWAVTAIGIPWFAPVSRDAPILLPVRSAAALLWALGAYALQRLKRP